MDIDLLSKMVKELILDRDKIVLPGLGAFVAEIVSSTFSDKGYTINPPYRRLFFRSKPDAGDELAVFYAASNSVEVAAAEKIIGDFCSELKGVLYEKKTVVFPGLGRLRATKENHVFFVADEDLDIYPAGFGLEPVSLKTHQETPEQVSAVVADLKQIVGEVPQSVVLPVVPEVEELPESQEQNTEAGVGEVAVEVTEGTVEEVTEEQQEVVEDTQADAARSEQTETESTQKEEIQTEQGQVEQVQTRAEETQSEQIQAEETAEVATDKAAGETPAEDAKPWWKTFLKVVMWILIVAIVLLLAYVVIGRTCPDLVDTYLYTPEELEIVKDL